MATAATVFRDYETDGVPASGRHKPKKPDIRQWGAGLESIINAFLSNGGLIFASLSALNADLAHGANSMAWVLGDVTVANNGIYRKIGGSGSGSWTRVADLPFSFIIASDVGAGTANAIQATTSLPVSSSALVWANVFEANTASPVTISFNGGTALTIKTNSGGDVVAGGLTAGMIVLGIVSGSTFRLVSDQASAAILAAAEAAKTAAQAAQVAAAASAAAAAASAASVNLPTAVAETYLRQKTDLSGYETRTPTQVVSDLAVPLKTAFFGHIRENAFPSIMQWVTDPGAADWAPYFNAAFAAIAAVSQYKGTTILVPGERRIQVSQCNPILSSGVYLEGSGRVNWPDRATASEDSSTIYGLGGTQDVFVWGNGGAGNVRGGGIRNMNIHMDNKTGGSAVVFNGVWYSELRNIFMMGCNSGVTVAGGYDHTSDHLHIEGYKNYGMDVYGTDTLRGDRLTMRDVTIAGMGTESSMTSTGDSMKIRGYWHSANINTLRLIKNGRYGLVLESAYSDPNMKPHYISIENLECDYGNSSHIFASHVRKLAIREGYFNSNLLGTALDFGTNGHGVRLHGVRAFGSYARMITFKGKTMHVSDSTFMAWNKAVGGTEPCIAVDGGTKVNIHDNMFGAFEENTSDPTTAGRLGLYTSAAGIVHYHHNQHYGTANPGFNIFAGSTSNTDGNLYA